MKGSSGVTAVAAADFLATFLAATFLTAVFLTAAFFAAVLVAAFLATRLVAGGVSWSVSLLIRNRLESWGAWSGFSKRGAVESFIGRFEMVGNIQSAGGCIDLGLKVIGRGALVVTGHEEWR